MLMFIKFDDKVVQNILRKRHLVRDFVMQHNLM